MPFISSCPKIRSFCLCSILACLFSGMRILAQEISAPRFFNMNVQTIAPAQQLVGANAQAYPATDYEPTNLIQADLKFPIKLWGNTKWIGQVEYNNELVAGTYVGYNQEGERIKLHQFGLALITAHKINEQLSIMNQLKFSNNSDQFSLFGAQTYTLRNSFLLEQKVRNGSQGLGFSVSIAGNGRFSILPVLTYQRDWQNDWGIEVFLPSKILLNKNLNTASRLIFGLKGSAANYGFSAQPLLLESSQQTYRRMDVNAIVGYERQLTPWVGVGVEAGATTPLYSGIYKLNGGWESLHDFGSSGRISPYFNFNVFFSFAGK